MQIKSLESLIYISDTIQDSVTQVLSKFQHASGIFILTDENTRKHCLPMLSSIKEIGNARIIEIKSGEQYKNITTLCQVWSYLSHNAADRKSVLINLGGGVLCDLGGFAASTFKRGIDFINIPTTLLAQVDASIGGKLGIDYEGFKNEIGLFKAPDYVIIDTEFVHTIDNENLVSGFGEMIKHALINSASNWQQLKQFDPFKPDYKKLKTLVTKSVLIKNDFVNRDPREKDVRRALNYGHTIGHAFESFLLKTDKPILHGHAVAHGMICETYLSYKKLGLSQTQLQEITDYLLRIYGKISFSTADYQTLFEYMTHDKKNELQRMNFSLIPEIGTIEINQICTEKEIYESLDYYREQ